MRKIHDGQLKSRHRKVLHTLWSEGKLSRWELHKRTGLRPTTVGNDATTLLKLGIVRECRRHATGVGRPSIPLEIDPQQRHVIGLSVQLDRIEVTKLNLQGEIVGSVASRKVGRGNGIAETARELLLTRLDRQTLGIGLSTSGKFDPQRRLLLFGSWVPGWKNVPLDALYDVIGDVPVLLENDMQAMAARWLLRQGRMPQEDVMLLVFGDHGVGAAMLLEQGAGGGYTTVDNELGHTRLPVETARCYCGHTGCLTQICSSGFLRQIERAAPSLEEAIAAYDGSNPGVSRMIELLGTGFANAANTICAERIVLVSELMRAPRFAKDLIDSIKSQLLFDQGENVTVDVWNEAADRPSETAGWLALAGLYITGFGSSWSRSSETGRRAFPRTPIFREMSKRTPARSTNGS